MTLLIMGFCVAVVFAIAGCGDSGGGSVARVQKLQEKVAALSTIDITETSTKANVYLGTDDRFTISNSGTTLYGGPGYDTVTIGSGVHSATLDQNVDQINFSGTSTNYVFRQTGNLINVFDAAGTTLLVKAPVQGDTDGTMLSFSDQLISASLGVGSVMKLVTVLNPHVTIVTSKGTIVVELYPAKAPITVRNFLTYVNEGFYSNTLFHRVVTGFVVQGGGFTTSGAKAPTHTPITLEPPSATGLTNAIGTIAMARTTALNSATSQFFFNTVDNNTSSGNNLDTPTGQGYAVFGSVISGMDVVQLIGATPTTDQTLLSDLVSIISITQTK
jgi:peptidyl-prolyl cis-trans isomerase A (cyclophilin A)